MSRTHARVHDCTHAMSAHTWTHTCARTDTHAHTLPGPWLPPSDRQTAHVYRHQHRNCEHWSGGVGVVIGVAGVVVVEAGALVKGCYAPKRAVCIGACMSAWVCSEWAGLRQSCHGLFTCAHNDHTYTHTHNKHTHTHTGCVAVCAVPIQPLVHQRLRGE